MFTPEYILFLLAMFVVSVGTSMIMNHVRTVLRKRDNKARRVAEAAARPKNDLSTEIGRLAEARDMGWV